jgi:citrate synthase
LSTEKDNNSGTSRRPSRRLGDYFRTEDWSDYWSTAVSKVEPGKILLRGYPIQEIIPKLSFAEYVYLTIRGELPSPQHARVLEAALCALPSHQWVAAHLLSASVVASAAPESPIPGIAAGILTAGSVTVSPQDTARLIERGLELRRAEGLAVRDAAERVVDEYRTSGRLIPGLGHPIEKEYDLRSRALAEVAKEYDVWGDACELMDAVHDVVAARTGKRLPINIDGMLGAVLTELGFTTLEMPGIAAIAVMPAIVACVVEEITDGVPLRIVPNTTSKYVGPPERHLD